MGDVVKRFEKKYFLPVCLGVAVLFSALLLSLSESAFSSENPEATGSRSESEAQIKGRDIAFDRKKGNCLSCHQIEGGTLAGTLGPPLMQMQARFPDRKALHEQIADARIRNPATLMPPFGAHGILSAEEIELMIEFLYGL